MVHCVWSGTDSPHFLKPGIPESSKSTTTTSTSGATFVMTRTSARTKQTSYVTNYPTLERPATPILLIPTGTSILDLDKRRFHTMSVE